MTKIASKYTAAGVLHKDKSLKQWYKAKDVIFRCNESSNTNSDSKVVSINACKPRNNKSKTNKQEGNPHGNRLFKVRELQFYQVEG